MSKCSIVPPSRLPRSVDAVRRRRVTRDTSVRWPKRQHTVAERLDSRRSCATPRRRSRGCSLAAPSLAPRGGGAALPPAGAHTRKVMKDFDAVSARSTAALGGLTGAIAIDDISGWTTICTPLRTFAALGGHRLLPDVGTAWTARPRLFAIESAARASGRRAMRQRTRKQRPRNAQRGVLEALENATRRTPRPAQARTLTMSNPLTEPRGRLARTTARLEAARARPRNRPPTRPGHETWWGGAAMPRSTRGVTPIAERHERQRRPRDGRDASMDHATSMLAGIPVLRLRSSAGGSREAQRPPRQRGPRPDDVGSFFAGGGNARRWRDSDTRDLRRRADIGVVKAIVEAWVLIARDGRLPDQEGYSALLHDHAICDWGYSGRCSRVQNCVVEPAAIAIVVWPVTFLTRWSAVRRFHARLARLVVVRLLADSNRSPRYVARLTAWVDWLAARTIGAELLKDVVRLEQAEALAAVVGGGSTVDERRAWRLVRLTDLLARLSSGTAAPARERWSALALGTSVCVESSGGRDAIRPSSSAPCSQRLRERWGDHFRLADSMDSRATSSRMRFRSDLTRLVDGENARSSQPCAPPGECGRSGARGRDDDAAALHAGRLTMCGGAGLLVSASAARRRADRRRALAAAHLQASTRSAR